MKPRIATDKDAKPMTLKEMFDQLKAELITQEAREKGERHLKPVPSPENPK